MTVLHCPVRWVSTLVLLGLIAIGWWGAASVSYGTLTGAAPCPNVLGVPACFVVLGGYSLLAAASLMHRTRASLAVFALGWSPAFLLAATGTALEMGVGNTCPRSGWGVPLCYVSLLLVLVIAVLFVVNRRVHAGAV